MTSPALPDTATPPAPAQVWKRLACMIAAPGRAQMRLYDAHTAKFSDTSRLTDALPSRPAAVYLYARGRTESLVLDFDVKSLDAARVSADFALASSWLTACGGVIVSDRSATGGRHLICPLAIGSSVSCDEVTSLMQLLAARLPTLDITPATNARTGCISVPGSRNKHGDHRRLDGSLEAAVECFTTRSAPDLLPRLHMLLGALDPAPSALRGPPEPPPQPDTFMEGVGDDRRLAAPYRRGSPIPDDVVTFATTGALSATRPTWKSRHEARMSVVVNAIARGYSLDDLRQQMAPGAPWSGGLGAAYARYHRRCELALSRDYAKALNWYVTNALKSSPPRHKEKNYTPGGRAGGWRGPKNLRQWLAHALSWADGEFAGQRYRWTVHAVLQCLAFYALVAGEERSGAWLVGVGGRSLSLGCGLLSEDTVWRVLADLRERPGAPLVLVRRGLGTEADRYALTGQNRGHHDAARVEQVRVEAVHPAWSVLGHHLRRVYELVAYHGLTKKGDVYAAARLPRATGDSMVLDLQIAGLLSADGWGHVSTGSVSLDDIAVRQGLDHVRQARLDRHRCERSDWRAWLHRREELRCATSAPDALPPPTLAPAGVGAEDEGEHAAWLRSVMSTGPPDHDWVDQERHVIEMVVDILGARLVRT